MIAPPSCAWRTTPALLMFLAGGFAPDRAVSGDEVESRPVTVRIDTSETPELEPWAREAKALVEVWHPRIAGMLRSEGFTPPSEVTLVFKKDKKGVADASGNRISIAADWVKTHPEDKGMVVHELTHVIQSYPPVKDGWLVEGLADYVRFYHFEPQTELKLRNPDQASYRDSYRTTAMFLEWIERTHDRAIVSRLNEALRTSRYDRSLFKTYTAKSLDELWADFVKDAKAASAK